MNGVGNLVAEVFEETTGYQNKGISLDRLCDDNSKDASKKKI